MACINKNSPAICCTNNVAEKTCIEVDKVFDVCMQQRSVSTTLTVAFAGDPTGATITCVKNAGPGIISNVYITPIPGSPCSRVSYCLTVPLIVEATTNAGHKIIGTSSITFDQDLVLRVPQDGIIHPEVVARAAITGVQSTLAGCHVSTTLCVTIITKVVADVILVIPSFGYPILPPCQEYTEDVCSGMFNTPVFPR
ncbi:MAG TPA: hypothetical protein PKY53_01515 [Clostridia bacterium]|nr:hypothetical protein [Clostridia bacterium]